MLQRLRITIVQLKADNASENILNVLDKFYIFVSSKRNYLKSIQQQIQ